MAATSSLSLELLAAIQVPNLLPMPAYLSEADSLTVAEFLQTHYAAYYKIDVSNVHWSGEINTTHLFDIFCNFQLQKDSVKTRIDMISFVTSNYRRYSWDCDLFLRMNKLTLNDWVSKMSYWGNCGDALAIYVMSDMYGVHTCVVTKSKPWTTVANTFQGTDIDILKLCQVKLVYLGNHKYRKLIPKDFIGQSSYVSPSFNISSMIQPLPPPPLPTPTWCQCLSVSLKRRILCWTYMVQTAPKHPMYPWNQRTLLQPLSYQMILMLWTKSWAIAKSQVLLENTMSSNQLMLWTVLCLPHRTRQMMYPMC